MYKIKIKCQITIKTFEYVYSNTFYNDLLNFIQTESFERKSNSKT